MLGKARVATAVAKAQAKIVARYDITIDRFLKNGRVNCLKSPTNDLYKVGNVHEIGTEFSGNA
jgi:hypothetical protein